MRMIKKLLKTIFLLPVLPILSAGVDGLVDMTELSRIVDERTARAENAVLKDYFSQLGLSDDQKAKAAKDYRAYRKAQTPTDEQLAAAKQEAAAAKLTARKAGADAEARVQMALLGVREECFGDVMTLAAGALEAVCADDEIDSAGIRSAIENVIDRVPSFTDGGSVATTGSPGRFPRSSGVADSYKQRLSRARELGDNAAAAAVISQAAAVGVSLR